MRRNYKAWPASVVPLMILCLGCTLFALGQGPTGRETPNASSRKNPPAPKRTPSSSRKTTRTNRSTAPANNRGQQTSEELKADDSPPTNAGSVKPAAKLGPLVRNQIGMDLVYVPAGNFMMGSNNGDPDEKPVHHVTFKEGFYVGRYEVTQAEWQQVMGNNPSNFKGDNLPVEQVPWHDAQSFISKLNERGDGFKYRLPTEAEWEYACRAGTTGDFAGDLNEMAWFFENFGSRTHAVGGKRPNAWGLADMHGNVWEWCADYYHETYYGAPTDGSAWLTAEDVKYRVLRGGSLLDNAALLRSAYRRRLTSADRSGSIGFRVVAVVRTQ